MKNEKYKKNLFSRKLENISNSRHLILVCSIVYEEIFNTTLHNSQLPLRDNIQPFEDIFHNNYNKINKIITLSVDLTNNNCKILRAGKGLNSYINTDLFDLFPLVFKEYQINLFMSSILENFELIENKEDINNNNKKNVKFSKRFSSKSAKIGFKTNKIKNEFIEIKLILCDNISSKMYYKLLTLKLTPLFNNDTQHFLLFDGIFTINKNTLITLQDFEENKKAKEKLIGISEPEFEKFNEIYSIPFKKYILWLNKGGYIESKEATFNISVKVYNIYTLTRKEKFSSKRISRKSELIGIIREDEDEESQKSFKKNTKLEKIQFIEDNASVSSQQTTTSYSNGISNLGNKTKKKDNIYEYRGFNNIKKADLVVIIFALVILLIEFYYLNYLENNAQKNNNSLLDFREFSKLYFQLFSFILGIAYISNGDEYLRIIDIFSEQYFNELNPNEEYFNFTLYIMIQNKILAKSMMEKRSYLNNIHKFIGNNKYNELFGKEIEYLRVTQNVINNSYYYDIAKVKMQFSEAILTMCNSFQILAGESTSSIYFLNKTNTPFSLINEFNKSNIALNEYQKYFYEMILNYNYFYTYFFSANEKLKEIILSKASFIKAFAYIYITLDTSLIITMGTLMLAYTMIFEIILIKIINYINMIMNFKNDYFNFSSSFLKKIENLKAILNFYKSDPAKSVQNLNNLYNNYQQYLTITNKNKVADMNKKTYKKFMENNKINELDDVPKNQRIMNLKDVKDTGLTFIYIFVYYAVLVLVLALYLLLLILWTKFFSKRDNYYILMQKNLSLEKCIYTAINAYDLMVYQSLTINEVTEIIMPNNYKNDNALIKYFYEQLKYVFNSKKEKNNIGNIYHDLEEISDFTCNNIFNKTDIITEIENDARASSFKNITQNLINLCEFIKITETNDFRIVFERHIQYARNGISSLNDLSYEGIIKHLINDKYLSKISLFFDTIVINVLHLTNSQPQRKAFNRLIQKLKSLVLLSEIIYLCTDIMAILFVIFFYLSGINNLCNQIFILRNIFKICQVQE